jgi:hypothetical protein
MKLFAISGFALVALMLVGLAVHVPDEGIVGSSARQVTLIVLMAVQAIIYLVAVRHLLRRPAIPRLVWLVLLVAAALRLPLLVSPPFLSSDINRYVWDGRVQAAGINPYRYVPDAPALANLRDSPVFAHINRADYARTIYPPAAQVIFAAVGFVWQSVYAVKATMLLFDVLAILCLMRLLADAGLPQSRVLIYAWNPLAAWAFASSGHIDAATIGLLAMAFLLRIRRRYALAGVLLGAAALIKFLPAAVAPALWRAGAGWRLTAAALATVVALYAIYISAGWSVLGFLGQYGSEEGLDAGSGVWLLAGIAEIVPLPAHAGLGYFVIAGGCLAVLAARIAFRPHPPAGSAPDVITLCGDAAILMACATVAVSPHYPWYFPWLALPCALVPYRAVLWLSVAPLAFYFDPLDNLFLWESIVYVPAILLATADLLGRLRASAAVAIEGNV